MATITYSWGTPILGFTLNGETDGSQADIAIAATADGGYLGAWSVGSGYVRGRYVDADGTPGSESDINTTTAGNQFDASMALLGNGNNVVSFTDHSSGTDVVRIRILGDGAPEDDFAVPTNSKPLRESDVTALGSDGFAVAYTRDYGGGDTDVFVQRYEADGDLVGGVIVVDSSNALATDHASITGLASGGFVVTWEMSAAAGGNHSTWFQLYDASGAAVTVAGDASGSHHLIDASGSINQDIQVAALQDGGFVVAYADNGWPGGDGTEITAEVFNADGTDRTNYIKVNTDVAGDQLHPTITVLSNGYFVVGWTDSSVLYYQAYDPSGAAIGSNFLAQTDVIEGEIAALADGLMANVRESSFTDGDGNSVRSSVHALIRDTVGTVADDTLTGDSLRDFVYGGDGSDTLNGNGADDALFGNAGADTLIGGAGADVLDGGAGADVLNGGAGTDTASYYYSAAGVTVDLAAGTDSGGDAAGDTLTGIENLYGSNQGNDTLAGDAGANKLQGWGGDDVLRGGAGADVLDGGAGTDTASWYTSAVGVTVDLVAGTASGGDAGGDMLAGIENLSGSQGSDTLAGSASPNKLQGWGGDDVLRGAAGADVLEGGTGIDTASWYTSAAGVTVDLAAGTGSGGEAAGDTLVGIENLSGSNLGGDTLAGNSGANRLQGWGGDDVLRGAAGADVLEGGTGIDTASYYTGTTGVTVDLAAGTASGGEAAGDVLSGIENLSGSNLDNDTLAGNAGANKLQGWGGDDLLRGGAGADTLEGGAGTDTVSYYSGAVGVAVNLAAGTASGGEAAGDVLTGIENLTGSNLGGDTLTGNAGANVLQGWGGNDTLVGGAGKDTLTGGIGADSYYFTAVGDSAVGANADVITDFSHLQADKVDVNLIDASTGVAGNQAFSFIGTGAYTGIAGQLRYSVAGGVTTIAGDVNGDSVSDFHITLTGSIALVAGDFVL